MAFDRYKVVSNTTREAIEIAKSQSVKSDVKELSFEQLLQARGGVSSLRTRTCACAPAFVSGLVIKKLTTSPPRRRHDDSPPTNSYWSAALLCPSRCSPALESEPRTDLGAADTRRGRQGGALFCPRTFEFGRSTRRDSLVLLMACLSFNNIVTARAIPISYPTTQIFSRDIDTEARAEICAWRSR